MAFHKLQSALVAGCLLTSIVASALPDAQWLDARQVPANATDVKTIKAPSGATIRYKEPGKAGVCETTPGVNSYSGYIDLAPDAHTFFWFFEARHEPENAETTLWLNGGPGSDSLIGLFQELGPCNVTADLKTAVNPYGWNEVSNLLFISQPLGVGFSYSEEQLGTLNPFTAEHENSSYGVDGRYPVINATEIPTTDQAAIATYHILQAFFDALPQLDGKVKSKTFNLWTESYGGHYGPSFFNYFYEQNQKIANGTAKGIELIFNTLGIGNGIYDLYTQAPYYPEFAVNNTYGIKAVNDTVYGFMKFACNMIGGCLDLASQCAQVNRSTDVGMQYCFQATDECRLNVEYPYYMYSGRGTYDIRHPTADPTPPSYFEDFLNTADAQNALGVNLNYTDSNSDVTYAFQKSGDFAYPSFLPDLEMLLNNSVSVTLYHGDADYICNWFGGEAASLNVSYAHAAEFKKAEYSPFVVNGVEYGEVRQYGNFSFVRVYEAGHEVPFYQPLASLELFRRALSHVDIASGLTKITGTFDSKGSANATHTEPYVAIPSSSGTNPPGSYTADITNPITSVPNSGLSSPETSSESASASTTDPALRPRATPVLKELKDII